MKAEVFYWLFKYVSRSGSRGHWRAFANFCSKMAIFAIFDKLHDWDATFWRFLARNIGFFRVSAILHVWLYLYWAKYHKLSRFWSIRWAGLHITRDFNSCAKSKHILKKEKKSCAMCKCIQNTKFWPMCKSVSIIFGQIWAMCMFFDVIFGHVHGILMPFFKKTLQSAIFLVQNSKLVVYQFSILSKYPILGSEIQNIFFRYRNFFWVQFILIPKTLFQ